MLRRRSYGIYVLGAWFYENRCAYRPYCKGKIEQVKESYDMVGNAIKMPNQFVCDTCSATYYSNVEITGSADESIRRCSNIVPIEQEWQAWFARRGYFQVRHWYGMRWEKANRPKKHFWKRKK